ncbi:MAG TPA: hypothetical protein VGB08_03975 [Allosphingosinicella sp.]
MSFDQVRSGLDVISLLFAWQQGGDPVGPQELISTAIATDAGLIETLESLVSTVTSSSGSKTILKKDNLSAFLDYDAVVLRVNDLQKDSALGERAKRLSAAFQEGAGY